MATAVATGSAAAAAAEAAAATTAERRRRKKTLLAQTRKDQYCDAAKPEPPNKENSVVVYMGATIYYSDLRKSYRVVLGELDRSVDTQRIYP